MPTGHVTSRKQGAGASFLTSAEYGHTRVLDWVLDLGFWARRCRGVVLLRGRPGRGLLDGGGEVEEAGRLGQLEGGEDGPLAGGEFAALGDLAFGGGEGDQVHPFEFVADVAPGVAHGRLRDALEQQGQPL